MSFHIAAWWQISQRALGFDLEDEERGGATGIYEREVQLFLLAQQNKWNYSDRRVATRESHDNQW